MRSKTKNRETIPFILLTIKIPKLFFFIKFMPRTVLGDSDIVESLQASLFASKCPFQIGLIVGRMTSARDYILSLLPTPAPETDDGKPGEPFSGWSDLDEGWVIDHAKLISRLMPGGLMVMGIYVFAPADQSEKKTGSINNILRKIFRAQSKDKIEKPNSEEEKERLYLQLCSKTKVNKCKAFDVSDASSKGGNPAELKWTTDVASSLVALRTRFKFDISVPIDTDDAAGDAAAAAVRAAVKSELLRIRSAIVLIDGALPGASLSSSYTPYIF